MADLSEHLNPVGELFLGLAGFLLLLSMHAPFRQWARAQLLRSAKIVARMYASADAHSESLHRWTVAFRMIFRDRRGLLIIVAAIIVFEYVLSGYQSLVHLIVAGPGTGQTHWDQPRGIEYSYFYWASTNLLGLIGYALFGWIALQHARGSNFDAASHFRPYALFAVTFCCFSGLTFTTSNIQPAIQIFGLSRYWFNDPEISAVLGDAAKPILAGMFVYGASAFILVRNYSARAFPVIFSGFCGFVIAVQVINWLHWPSNVSFRHGPYRMLDILNSVSNFTYTVLWAFAFVAFIVVLAAPGEDKTAPTEHPQR